MLKRAAWLFISFWVAASNAHICRWKVAGSDYKPRILILSAEEQTQSKTEIIVSETEKVAKKSGFEVEVIVLKNLPQDYFKSDTHFSKSLSLRAAHDQRFEQADALLIVTPEYDGNASGLYYHYMNHMRANLTGLPVGIISLSAGFAGGRQASDLMAGPLLHRKALLDGQARIFMPNIDKVVDASSKTITDKSLLNRVQALLEQLGGYSQTRALNLNLLTQASLSTKKSNDFEFNSQVIVRGPLESIEKDDSGRPYFMKWSGPVQLMRGKTILPGQGKSRHRSGFSTPIGDILVKGQKVSLTQLKKSDLEQAGLYLNSERESVLEYASGIRITGKLTNAIFDKKGQLQVLTFEGAWAKQGTRVLYEESWGPYDVLVAERLDAIYLNE